MFNLPKQEIQINHSFTKNTTIYRSENDFQKKAILLRLLEIRSDGNRQTKSGKILSEIAVNLGRMVGKVDFKCKYPFDSKSLPVKVFIEVSFTVLEIAPIPEGEQTLLDTSVATQAFLDSSQIFQFTSLGKRTHSLNRSIRETSPNLERTCCDNKRLISVFEP